MLRIRACLSMVCIAIFASTSLLAETNWPTWRGPLGNGHSTEKNVPVKWDEKSVTWKTELPGIGQSSPIIWGNRIFLTTALEGGKQRMVFCVDRTNGKILWEQIAWKGEPEKTHKMNGHASPSCVTDGEHVYAFFGKGGLHCYTVDGKHVWSRDLGEFAGNWGTGASPILLGDLLIQNCDATDKAYLLAVNKKTGKDVWKTPRDVPPRGGWSTPVLIETAKGKELVLNGEKGADSYDPETGKHLWFSKSVRGRGEPTVTPGKGVVYVLNGQPGNFYAVRLGGSGDVTNSHVVWSASRAGGRDQPSPIVIGNYVIVVNMKGIATCYDATDGKLVWKQRLQGQFVGTPMAVNGQAYFTNEAGDTYVIEPGPTAKIVAINKLNAPGKEIFRATPTPMEGQLFIRSTKTLYLIENQQK